MIVFMLNDAAGYPIKCFGVLHKFLVEVFDRYLRWTLYIFAYFRNAETAFVIRPFLATQLNNMRIDK